jgi:hypothetical protein
MKSLKWCFTVVFFCTSFVKAVEINVFGLSSMSVRISTECIDATFDNQEESVAVHIYTKTNAIGKFMLEGDTLEDAYEKARKKFDGMEPFFGKATEILLVETESQKSFKVSIEASGKRFQISPMVKLGDGQYAPTKFSYASNLPSLLKVLQGLNLPQPNQGSMPQPPDK